MGYVFRFTVCHVDLEVGEVAALHYLVEHKGELVWNRKDRLKLITTDTVVRSKILAGAQKPTRLANGAIAKNAAGSTLLSPTFNSSIKHSGDSVISEGPKCKDLTAVLTTDDVEQHQLQWEHTPNHARLPSSQQTVTTYKETLLLPEKRRKSEHGGGHLIQQRSNSSCSNTSSSSGKSTGSNVVLSHENQPKG